MINIFIGIVFPVVWKIGSSELTKNGDGEEEIDQVTKNTT